MVVQLTFDFEVQLLRSIYQKNGKAMAFVLVQESWKLTKYFESERERTLVSSARPITEQLHWKLNFSTSLLQRFTAESSQKLRRNAVP